MAGTGVSAACSPEQSGAANALLGRRGHGIIGRVQQAKRFGCGVQWQFQAAENAFFPGTLHHHQVKNQEGVRRKRKRRFQPERVAQTQDALAVERPAFLCRQHRLGDAARAVAATQHGAVGKHAVVHAHGGALRYARQGQPDVRNASVDDHSRAGGDHLLFEIGWKLGVVGRAGKRRESAPLQVGVCRQQKFRVDVRRAHQRFRQGAGAENLLQLSHERIAVGQEVQVFMEADEGLRLQAGAVVAGGRPVGRTGEVCPGIDYGHRKKVVRQGGARRQGGQATAVAEAAERAQPEKQLYRLALRKGAVGAGVGLPGQSCRELIGGVRRGVKQADSRRGVCFSFDKLPVVRRSVRFNQPHGKRFGLQSDDVAQLVGTVFFQQRFVFTGQHGKTRGHHERVDDMALFVEKAQLAGNPGIFPGVQPAARHVGGDSAGGYEKIARRRPQGLVGRFARVVVRRFHLQFFDIQALQTLKGPRKQVEQKPGGVHRGSVGFGQGHGRF
ncbi:MAG: hypothetical protein IPH12_00150 [Saprospirales bacterium]|nr:hypothetical protein [Saprospirales bacterium]